uniref:pyruvate dehydrogenase (acetyl-transferring) n=1 Tax=Aegilops tauschii subsp. strangulata TaxID=200361 RepID=A0A453JKW1_AEGTS
PRSHQVPRSARVAAAARRPGSTRARGGLVARAVVAAKGEVASSDTGGHEVLMFEALREAMIEEMTLDPTVCMIGEDVGDYGGSYKVSKG